MGQARNTEPSDMERLAVLLSMPRQNTYNALPEIERPAGLPINALPGWESIPLHSKLPMLKCPDNQVIFSKNKIGRTFETWQRDFDSVCQNLKMEYNPLHDPHLRRFYSNEKLLKRLRDNGEITENNDVICTLKEFNEHRIPLHETYLSLIRMERNKLNEQKGDKQLIQHAEKIAERERKLRERNRKGKTYAGEIIQRKAELTKQREQQIQALKLRAQRKDQQIEAAKAIRQVVWNHKKELHKFKIQHRLDVSLDIRRKRLIALKKHLQFKSDRLKMNTKLIKENAKKIAKEKARQSWEAHLQERIIKHEHLKMIIKENEQAMREWIDNHMEKYQQKWNKIQMQLDARSHHHIKRKKKRKRVIKKAPINLEQQMDDDQLKNLTNEDIHDALYTALDIQNPTSTKKPDTENYIYKAAKFILESILAKFNKDLSCETYIDAILANRIARLFIEVKQYVIKRATQIISNLENIGYSNGPCGRAPTGRISASTPHKRVSSMLKIVTFNSYSALIGKGSYAVFGDDLKETAARFPTPAGSLTSVVIEPSEEDDETIKVPRKSFGQLTREEQIFIEHLFIKFKRELIVGIGRQVLAAIECHRNNKILAVRRELQDITKEFLVKVMTRSILSYAVNSCNFHSNSLLCQYALAGDIILYLQQNLLKPERDPREIVQPRSRCTCPVPTPFARYCKRRFH